jgi:BlaI family transcriptional regulator, penicillinase repressor
MSRSTPDSLTPAEWKVMRIVWEHKKCAARDVYQLAGEEHGWAASTAKTILRRLVEKGHLKTTRVGNSFLYTPTRPAMHSLRGAADMLLDNALGGTVGPLLVHIAKKGNLSAGELAELRDLLNELSSTEEDRA